MEEKQPWRSPEPLIDPEIAGWCCGIMDGDVAAIKGLAKRMRQLKNAYAQEVSNRRKLSDANKFYICLVAFPSRAADFLRCQFALRVLPLWERYFPKCDFFRVAFETRIRWLEGMASFDELMSHQAKANELSDTHHKPIAGRTIMPWESVLLVLLMALNLGTKGSPYLLGTETTGVLAWHTAGAVVSLRTTREEKEAEFQWQLSRSPN